LVDKICDTVDKFCAAIGIEDTYHLKIKSIALLQFLLLIIGVTLLIIVLIISGVPGPWWLTVLAAVTCLCSLVAMYGSFQLLQMRSELADHMTKETQRCINSMKQQFEVLNGDLKVKLTEVIQVTRHSKDEIIRNILQHKDDTIDKVSTSW